MHIDIPRAQLLIEERDTMETVGKLTTIVYCCHRGSCTCFYFQSIQKMNLVIAELSLLLFPSHRRQVHCVTD